MGKHKNRGKNRQQRRSGTKKSSVGREEDTAKAHVPEPASALLAKIRHADPQTRLAALTALAHYPSHSKYNVTLWQAVREQVMDSSNLTVAAMAATCLEEFLLLPPKPKLSGGGGGGGEGGDTTTDLATAGWYLLLLGRVQEAFTRVSSTIKITDADMSGNEDKKNTAKKNKDHQQSQHQQWLSLASACLSTITCLVQENSVVMERLERTPSLRKDSFSMLWQWLSWSLVPTSASTPEEDATNRQQLQEQVANLFQVLMEDNFNVVEPWYQEEKETAQVIFKGVWDLVHSDSSSPSNQLSSLSRLHLIGVLLAAFSQLSLSEAEKKTWDVGTLLDKLKSYLALPSDESGDDPSASQRKASLWHFYQHAQEQEQDFTLETDVLKQQNIKKESARAIARRLKLQEQQQQHATMAMEDANDDLDKETNKPGMLAQDRTDYLQKWHSLLNEWRRQHVALELALEMAANLTSSVATSNQPGNAGGGAMAIDEQDRDWMQVEEGPLDAVVLKAFQNQLPLFQNLLNQISQQLPATTTQGGKSDDAQPQWPPAIVQHWVELQSKVAACLMHILAMPSPSPKKRRGNITAVASEHDRMLSSLWRDLVRAFELQPTLAGTMVVALQMHPQLCSQEGAVTPDDVNLFLHRLDQNCDDSTTAATASTAEENDMVLACTSRDLIALLGMILCNQEHGHSADMNVRVCHSLMQAGTTPSSSAYVVAESLNVLMDIYGQDDCHPDVFDKLQVLLHFQKVLPVLKQKLSFLRGGRRVITEEEEEYLKEVLLNASRFIQYKKGHSN